MSTPHCTHMLSVSLGVCVTDAVTDDGWLLIELPLFRRAQTDGCWAATVQRLKPQNIPVRLRLFCRKSAWRDDCYRPTWPRCDRWLNVCQGRRRRWEDVLSQMTRTSPSILSGTLISDSRAPLRHVNHAGRWSDDSSDWSDCDSHRWGRRESDRTFSILALDCTLKSILWLPFGLFLNRPTSYLCSEAQRQDGVLKGRVSVHVRRNAWNYHTHTFRFKLIWCQIELEMLLETN